MKISIDKELLLTAYDYIIAVVEINHLTQQKMAAVRAQDYDTAKKIQDRETEVAKSIPSPEVMKGLRDQIFNLDKPSIELLS